MTCLLLLITPPNDRLARHTESQVVYHVYHAQNVMIARRMPLLLRYDERASSFHAAAMPAWPTIKAQVVYQVQTPNAKVPYSLFICIGLLSFFILLITPHNARLARHSRALHNAILYNIVLNVAAPLNYQNGWGTLPGCLAFFSCKHHGR